MHPVLVPRDLDLQGEHDRVLIPTEDPAVTKESIAVRLPVHTVDQGQDHDQDLTLGVVVAVDPATEAIIARDSSDYTIIVGLITSHAFKALTIQTIVAVAITSKIETDSTIINTTIVSATDVVVDSTIAAVDVDVVATVVVDFSTVSRASAISGTGETLEIVAQYRAIDTAIAVIHPTQ